MELMGKHILEARNYGQLHVGEDDVWYGLDSLDAILIARQEQVLPTDVLAWDIDSERYDQAMARFEEQTRSNALITQTESIVCITLDPPVDGVSSIACRKPKVRDLLGVTGAQTELSRALRIALRCSNLAETQYAKLPLGVALAVLGFQRHFRRA